ncbi:MAG TPA: NYN domain-containing protein [Ktedonobacterales bacterium]
MSEEIALFIDFENIRYSLLNIQRREPDPQELISVARHYGTVMVARAYADWTRQPDQFKGSLMAAMIDRVDCPAKMRDRFRPYWGTTGTTSGATDPRVQSWAAAGWPSDPSASGYSQGGTGESEESLSSETLGYQGNGPISNGVYSPNGQAPSASSSGMSGPLPTLREASGNGGARSDQSAEGPRSGGLSASTGSSGNTGPMSVVQSTVSQSTVDLNMLMDIIETVFDRPTIGTFVLMTGDRDFTRISARLKLRLNKSVIVVGVPGTVSRDLISAASQFVALTPNSTPMIPSGANPSQSYPPGLLGGITGPLPALGSGGLPGAGTPLVDPLEPGFIQFLDYIDRNWSWRTIIGISNFVGDSINPKNRFRGRLTRDSARDLLNVCIQEKILLVQQDGSGGEDLRLNRTHTQVEEVLRQLSRS